MKTTLEVNSGSNSTFQPDTNRKLNLEADNPGFSHLAKDAINRLDTPLTRIAALLILMFAIAAIIPHGLAAYQADSNLEITAVTDESITWYYNYTSAPLVASLDGNKIEAFDNRSNFYTAGDLSKGSTHVFCIYVENQNCEIGNTTITPESSEKVYDFINLYIYAIIAVICLLVSWKLKPVAWLALLFSLFGILNSINNSFNMALVFVTLTLVSIASLGYE